MSNLEMRIGDRFVGDAHPTFFIADISANHDGDIERARALIHMAASAGADAAKFQNFKAETIVSDSGFRSLGGKQSHQSKWKKSVFEVYKAASLPLEWTPILKKECDDAGIVYFSTPYDQESVDYLDPFVPAFKVGSGDLTWPEIYLQMAGKGKPILIATGACHIGEVQSAVEAILQVNNQLVLMQCNTNYTGSLDNFRHIHLRVLDTYRTMFPSIALGLSDHTPGHATVLGAVALGARVIEKHFTDDTTRVGPDHSFSMTPSTWREMVDRTRELELALGSPVKVVSENEKETVIVQRRCLRARRDLPVGTILSRSDIDVLRPAPLNSISPSEISRVVGARTLRPLNQHDLIAWSVLEG